MTPAAGVSRLPLSSTARDWIRACAEPVGDPRIASSVAVPAAGCHVCPPSVDTSTPATWPPPASVAVPAIVTAVPFDDGRARRGERDHRGRRGSVGRSDGRHQLRLERRRLRAHVCEEVHRRLLHPSRPAGAAGSTLNTSCTSSRPQAHCTVPAPKTSAPLGSPIQRQGVRCRAGGVDVPVVLDVLVDGQRRGRKPHQPRRSEAVVPVLVPLVSERARRERCRLTRRERPRCWCFARDEARRMPRGP